MPGVALSNNAFAARIVSFNSLLDGLNGCVVKLG